MAGLDRALRRARGRRGSKSSEGARALPSPLAEQMNALAVLGGFCNHVSMTLTGLSATPNGALASAVFAKCCAHARSITAVAIQSSMFDHHAIMSLARMIVEASTMIAYLLDPVGPEEQAFRNTLLRLHDTVNRIELLRAFDGPADDLRAGREELRSGLAADPVLLAMPEERRLRVLGGEEMFAVGMRAVATRMMGWDERRFGGVYAYFSAHAHSSPMSFMRVERHGIDYYHPSEAQFGIPSFAIEVATACLRRSMLRMVDLHPEKVDAFHPELLADARAEDAACPLFAARGS